MINRIKLDHLVELMVSDNYRDRFCAEYIQLKQRYERLKAFNNKIEAAMRMKNFDNRIEEPPHDCPEGLLREQQAVMGEYLHLLEVRAFIEDIDLDDAEKYLIYKALKAERAYHGFDAECQDSQKIYEEIIQERRLELSVCGDCIHFPICNYLVGRLEKFKLPSEKNSCDMFESVNGYGEQRIKDESDVTLK